MERFIGDEQIYLSIMIANLKSSMERFIAHCIDDFMIPSHI